MARVTVNCAECHEDFRYDKKSNVARKYCDDCAESRVHESKQRSLNNQKEERRQERVAQAKLALIPDFEVNPHKLIDRYIAGKR